MGAIRNAIKVSIPSERESALQEGLKSRLLTTTRQPVSIPSERESALQGIIVDNPQHAKNGFNSLRTGKCFASYRKRCRCVDYWCIFVSIPSERESALQAKDTIIFTTSITSFNSLRTGKCFARTRQGVLKAGRIKFQFPPNGKVLCKFDVSDGGKAKKNDVSIPSERESALQEEYNYNSPVTELEFQFPPNGKVLCKFLPMLCR